MADTLHKWSDVSLDRLEMIAGWADHQVKPNSENNCHPLWNNKLSAKRQSSKTEAITPKAMEIAKRICEADGKASKPAVGKARGKEAHREEGRHQGRPRQGGHRRTGAGQGRVARRLNPQPVLSGMDLMMNRTVQILIERNELTQQEAQQMFRIRRPCGTRLSVSTSSTTPPAPAFFSPRSIFHMNTKKPPLGRLFRQAELSAIGRKLVIPVTMLPGLPKRVPFTSNHPPTSDKLGDTPPLQRDTPPISPQSIFGRPANPTAKSSSVGT